MARLPSVSDGAPWPATPPPALPTTGERSSAWYAEPANGPDWRRIMAAVFRYKWVVAAVTILGTAGTALVVHSLRQPYAASATVWIDQGDPESHVGAPRNGWQMLDAEAWLDLLRSYAVLDNVVRQLGLYLEPARAADSAAFRSLGVAEQFKPGHYKLTRSETGDTYALTTGDGMPIDRVPAGDSIGRTVGLRWAPAKDAMAPGHTAAFTLVTPRDASGRLGDALDARIDKNGNFLHIDLQGPDPHLNTAIVNAVAQRYVSVAADLKRQKMTELTRMLDDQMAYVEKSLKQAESTYAAYRVRAITLPSDPVPLGGAAAAAGGAAAAPAANPLADSYFQAQVERAQLERDRQSLAAALAAQGDSGVSTQALDVIGAVQHDAELSGLLDSLRSKQAALKALRLRYADAYLPVQRLSEEVHTLRSDLIPGAMRRVMGELASRAGALAGEASQTAQSLRAAPPRAIEGARLQRALASAQDLYAQVRQRDEEARLTQASAVPDVRVLDAAVVPLQPVRNTAPRFMALGFLGSLGLALAGVIVLDRVDPRVRYPEQVSDGLGLTILGAVPHLTGREGKAPSEMTTAAVIEALRGIRLNLLYATGPGRVVLTVTSPGSGDGKSFLTANLGLSFAEAGYRTLVIDGDIRRGVLHRGLGGKRRPGLVDLLMGETSPESVVQATPYPGLSLIASGARRRDAPERLSSQQMTALMARLKDEYEVVLCDSPPLTAGIDPYTLAALTGRVMLVLRTGVSRREVTSIKLQVFSRLPVELVGAVLNDVPLNHVYESYSYYLPGYEAADEGDGALSRRIV